MLRALVLGSGGIGSAVVDELRTRFPDCEVICTWNKTEPSSNQPGVIYRNLDVTSESEIKDVLSQVGDLDLLLNTIGVLHAEPYTPEKTINRFDEEFFIQNIRVNTLPTLLLAKYSVKNFNHSRQSIFATVSAKVGSIEDNRLGGWYSYRCSKAALNMAIKNLSHEWKRTRPNVCVAALHPGTTDTPLSKPFQKNVKPEKLFSASKTACFLLDVIDKLDSEKTGRFWSWDGKNIAW